MTLQRRLALASAGAVLLTSLAATAVVFVTVRGMQTKQVDKQLTLRLQNSDPRMLRGEIERSAQTTSFITNGTPVYLYDAYLKGRHTPSTGVTTVVPMTGTARADIVDVRTVDIDSTLANHVRIAQVRFPSGSVLRVMRSVDDITRNARDIGLAVALIGSGFALLAAVGIALLVGSGLRPIRELAEDSVRAGQTGDFSGLIKPPADTQRPDEVAELTHALSFMAASLSESKDRQQRLVDDAAHELRTPLTSLRTNLQFLEQAAGQGRPLAEGAVTGALQDALAESSELADLTEELVALAATGAEPGRGWTQEVVDIAQLARDIGFRASRRSGRAIEVSTPAEGCDVLGVRLRLERALGNVVGNATKFCEDGPINVTVWADSGLARVAVEDAGPGIAPEDRARVTERFWRAPAMRGRPGSGLGLAIVADVVAECGGSVDIGHSQDLGGARIVVSLPLAPAEPLTPPAPGPLSTGNA